MAVHARSSLEDKSSRSFFFILIRWLLLRSCPGVEVFWRIHVYAQQHLRVLSPAVLRALTEKQARLMGIDPSLVWVIRNQVCLSCKLRYPEAVIRVGGKQFQECRCGMSGVTHGDMEFVRGDDPETGIPEFPPELMPDCGHLHPARGLRRILNRMNHTRRRKEQYNHDQNRNDRPCELDLRASVHLRRLAFGVCHTVSEFHDGIAQ